MRNFGFSIIVIMALLTLWGTETGSAQGPSNPSVTLGVPWHGGTGTVETVAQIMARDKRASRTPASDKLLPRRLPHPSSQSAVGSSRSNPPRMTTLPRFPSMPSSSPTIGTSFLGVQLTEASPPWKPPDTMGGIGPSQIFFVVNGRVKVFDKSGNLGTLSTTLDNFFDSVRTTGQSAFDPRVRYDRLSGRWIVTSLDFANRVLIAVSSGSTITDTSSFSFYQFQFDQVGVTPNADTGAQADFDTLGVDKNYLYIGIDVFGIAYNGSTGFVIDKPGLLGGTLLVTPFRQLTSCLTKCNHGPVSPIGVDNDDPASTEGYFAGADNLDPTIIMLRRVTTSGGVPAISDNISITVPAMTLPIPVTALGSSFPLDPLDTRLFNAMVKKNDLTGDRTLWTAQNIEVDSSGTAIHGGGRTGSRWYQIGNLTGAPTVLQYGTLFDSASSNPRSFFIPSVAMSGQGHAVLGASMASALDYAGIIVAGRLSSDAPNTLQPFNLALAGAHPYNTGLQACCYRWGDYSQTVVDPNDDMTIWTFQEYVPSPDNWGIRVVQLKAPPPALPAMASPSQLPVGQPSIDVVLAGAPVAGSGFFDPGSDMGGPGFANHITATVSGGVLVNRVTFITPTQITLNLSTVGVTPGAVDVTVINPDGQTSTAYCLLIIGNPSPAPSCRLIFPLVLR